MAQTAAPVFDIADHVRKARKLWTEKEKALREPKWRGTQKEFARALGVKTNVIGAIEGGDQQPHGGTPVSHG